MKKIDIKILIITCIVCLSPIIIGLVFYNSLPDSIAIHFDINNNPDNYFPKNLFIFGMPVIMMLFQIFCCTMTDLSDKNKEANKKAVFVYKWIIPVITIILYIVTMMYALGSNIDIRKIVMTILGVMFIVIGNYLPKTKGNNYLKFPKITDEKVMKTISRISGYIMVIDGFLCVLSILADKIVSIVVIILVVLEIVVLQIYASIKCRKK